MAGLQNLPSETIASIATYLRQHDLARFALVCSKFQAPAEDKLYQSPLLEYRYAAPAPRYNTLVFLRQFAVTLLRYPRLALKVRELTMVTAKHDGLVGAGVDSKCIDLASKVVDSVALTSLQWAARAQNWKERLRMGDGNAWGGLILALVPRLETLSIEILSRGGMAGLSSWDPDRFASNPTEKLFGFLSDSAPPEALLHLDLSVLPGLRNISELRFFGKELDANWCLLPNLQWLEVGRDCTRPDILRGCADSLEPLARPQVSYLTMEISTGLTLSNGLDQYGALRQHFLSPSTFPKLTSLRLCLTNVRFDGYDDENNDPEWNGPEGVILEPTYTGLFDDLLDRLGSIAATIQCLNFHAYSDMSAGFLSFIEPATDFTRFGSLRRLIVPQELLLGPVYGISSRSHTPLTADKLLPPSLQNLTLNFATVQVFDWLDEVIHHKKYLASLCSIYLVCDNLRGDIYTDVFAMSEVWLEDRTPWFCAQVFLAPWEEHANNQSSYDCDPYVVRVVRHLDSLHEQEAENVCDVVEFLEGLTVKGI